MKFLSLIWNCTYAIHKKLTAANGRPIADNQNSQTAGPRGPIMLQDPWLIEKLAHFDREVIPTNVELNHLPVK